MLNGQIIEDLFVKICNMHTNLFIHLRIFSIQHPNIGLDTTNYDTLWIFSSLLHFKQRCRTTIMKEIDARVCFSNKYVSNGYTSRGMSFFIMAYPTYFLMHISCLLHLSLGKHLYFDKITSDIDSSPKYNMKY